MDCEAATQDLQAAVTEFNSALILLNTGMGFYTIQKLGHIGNKVDDVTERLKGKIPHPGFDLQQRLTYDPPTNVARQRLLPLVATTRNILFHTKKMNISSAGKACWQNSAKNFVSSCQNDTIIVWHYMDLEGLGRPNSPSNMFTHTRPFTTGYIGSVEWIKQVFYRDMRKSGGE